MSAYHKGHVLVPYYSLFISTIPQAVYNSSVSMYVGDTSSCYKSPDTTQLRKASKNDLINLDIWLKGKKLSLNKNFIKNQET